ncbi:hypothetical protein GJ633_07850 [Halorubrum sp. CBA1125]|uniref:hypothetical protein n=1 Tax=Halorubrum sp. CBA1125 TaxID=2668072 RepID=UPI0012E7D6EE|nr:hypothetical protein [Halorubrum sp. CBA1125]MUW14595.1 hypothetical protein [Halorubrum sp. CBA1125]
MTDVTPSRRRVLLGGLAGAIGATTGCLGLDERAVDDGGAGDERVLALSLADGRDALRDRHVVDPESSDPRWDEAAFAAVRADEDYTTQYRKPFFSTPDDPTYAVSEGAYYRLGSVVVNEAAVTRPVLRLFGVEERAADVPDGVAAETLPEGDRRAVEIAHFAARARGNEGGVPIGLVERDGYVYRDDAAIDDSRLLDEDGPTHVRFRDTVYRVETERERFHEPVYRATGERVAESRERMEAILRATFVDARFSREGLSATARDVLAEARHGEYSEPHPFSNAYEEVLRALHAWPYLDGNVRNDAGATPERRTIRYDSRYYDCRLRFESAGGTP